MAYIPAAAEVTLKLQTRTCVDRKGKMAEIALLVLRLGQPSASLSPSDTALCRQMTEVVKQSLRGVQGRPVLFQYASDCTPMKVAHRINAGSVSSSSRNIIRQGYSLKEFLVQTGFLKYFKSDNEIGVKVLLREPLPLEHGKKAGNLFIAAVEFIPKFECLTQGIRLMGYVFDRAQYSSLGRMLAQAQRMKDERSKSGDAPLEPYMTWPINIPCAAHDAQNALKWALLLGATDAELIKDVFVIVESLRNSLDTLHMHLPAFVAEYITPAEEVLESEPLRQMWAALGQTDEVLEFLVESQLRFTRDQLMIHPSFADQEDAPERVATILMSVAKFPKFTESRWLSVASAARALTSALLVGMDQWAATCLSAEGTSEYYLGGYRRFSLDHKLLVMRIGMASYPADAFLAEVLEDDRLMRNPDHYADAILDEITYLANLDMQVWEMLCVAGNGVANAEAFRSDCMHSAVVVQAYIRDKTLLPLQVLPYSLGCMSPSEALEHVASLPETENDEVVMKIRTLLNLGADNSEMATPHTDFLTPELSL
eukprot:5549207-Amphidinium_carterae.1